jgi:hypothetical protein
MKKTIIVGLICIFLVCIPLSSAESIEKQNFHRNLIKQQTIQTTDIPEWALGNFTGIWGINIGGQPGTPRGLVFGYYATHRFVALFTNTTAPNGWLWGIRFGYFMFGIVANITGEQRTYFVGLGGFNETHFYYRIMGIVGPTFYIGGIYNPFE